MYDPTMVEPMRKELTGIGFKELRTPQEVDEAIQNSKGTSLVVVNSVCGCAAGQARPGVALALTNNLRPDNLFTVFAGQDVEATAHARSYIKGYPPSSPSMALFKDGELVFMLERYQIENNPAEQVASKLAEAFEKHCNSGG
ncbi:BrxA/BrxB family bacilliredoxin [candidate division KSB1 bacterium]|nr:BrxA/BrxB family bacilliredoxin [candidate division KSB1 bacterium]NIR71590.1 BrxA/BrxB family bacilliredoxin [candidate division KSB1 bacterium]NIS27972.1 BrxA/BrxB family bacilliredoxin [candidate division KSB1 bacterium]NIT74854.1 BrxA/BrxB family bacilliredoxin [candidate division KSB1 bacterium]NIU28629.1 BrxA/BrxB family bacilliredoxin [candidate division KSB1 bacterium]